MRFWLLNMRCVFCIYEQFHDYLFSPSSPVRRHKQDKLWQHSGKSATLQTLTIDCVCVVRHKLYRRVPFNASTSTTFHSETFLQYLDGFVSDYASFMGVDLCCFTMDNWHINIWKANSGRYIWCLFWSLGQFIVDWPRLVVVRPLNLLWPCLAVNGLHNLLWFVAHR